MLQKVFVISDNIPQDMLTYRISVMVVGVEALEAVSSAMGEPVPKKIVAKKIEDAVIKYGDADETEIAAIRRHEYALIVLNSFSPIIVPWSEVHIQSAVPGQAVYALFKGPLSLPDTTNKITWKFESSPKKLSSLEYPLYGLFPYISSFNDLWAMIEDAAQMAVKKWFPTLDVNSLLLRDSSWWKKKVNQDGIPKIIQDLNTVIGRDIVFTEKLASGQERSRSVCFAGVKTGELYSPFEFDSMGFLLMPMMLANPYALVDPRYTYIFPIMDLVASEIHKASINDDWRYKSFCHEIIRALELKDRSLLWTPNNPFQFDTAEDPRPEGSTRFKLDRVVGALYARSNVLKYQANLDILPYGVGWERGRVPNVFKDYLSGRITDPKMARSYLDKVAYSFTLPDGSTDIATIDRVEDDRIILEFAKKWGATPGPPIPLLAELAVSNIMQDNDLIQPTWTSQPVLPKDVTKLSTGQQQAAWNFYRHQASAVAGPPGTGKTYFISKILQTKKEMSGDNYIVILSPTNRGAQRVYESLAKYLDGELVHIFGRPTEDEDEFDNKPRTDYTFSVGIGTIASFMTKVNTDTGFADLLKGKRKGFYIIDEMSMTPPKDVSHFIRFVEDCGSDNVYRVLFLGDPYQLPSVDPGNAFTDMLRVIPTSVLGEHEGDQKRFTGQLEILFKNTRKAMSLCEGRHQLVQGIESGGPVVDKSGKKRIVDNGYVFPDNNLHVYPLKEPDNENFDSFASLEWRTIRVLYRVLSEWFLETSPVNEAGEPIDPITGEKLVIPAFPPRTVHDFNFLMRVLLQPNKPFVIVPYFYKHLSTPEIYQKYWKGYNPAANQIRYMSSARRVNEWIISMLSGDFGGYQPWWHFTPRAGKDPKSRIKYPLYSNEKFPAVYLEGMSIDPRTREAQRLFAPWDMALRKHQGLLFEDDILALNQKRRQHKSVESLVLERNNGVLPLMVPLEQDKNPSKSVLWYLSHYHRPYFIFHPGAPFVIRSGAFRNEQIFKGEIVWFYGKSKQKNSLIFEAEDLEAATEGKKAMRKVEIPLELCTKRHIDYGFAVNTHQVQGSEKPLIVSLWFQPSRGAGLLDLRSFYTAVTRSRIEFDHQLAKPIGRCVIIAGQGSLERMYDLEVADRATPFIRLLEEEVA